MPHRTAGLKQTRNTVRLEVLVLVVGPLIWLIAFTLRNLYGFDSAWTIAVVALYFVGLLAACFALSWRRHPCNCCGHLTLRPGRLRMVCDICTWLDGSQLQPSLGEARQNYEQCGACDCRWVHLARRPTDWERAHRKNVASIS